MYKINIANLTRNLKNYKAYLLEIWQVGSLYDVNVHKKNDLLKFNIKLI